MTELAQRSTSSTNTRQHFIGFGSLQFRCHLSHHSSMRNWLDIAVVSLVVDTFVLCLHWTFLPFLLLAIWILIRHDCVSISPVYIETECACTPKKTTDWREAKECYEVILSLFVCHFFAFVGLSAIDNGLRLNVSFGMREKENHTNTHETNETKWR